MLCKFSFPIIWLTARGGYQKCALGPVDRWATLGVYFFVFALLLAKFIFNFKHFALDQIFLLNLLFGILTSLVFSLYFGIIFDYYHIFTAHSLFLPLFLLFYLQNTQNVELHF